MEVVTRGFWNLVVNRLYREYLLPSLRYLNFWIFRPAIIVRELWIYPVKSCSGILLQKSELNACGLKWDRHWVVVDKDGKFMTQRKYPTMALIKCRFEDSSSSSFSGALMDVKSPQFLVLSATGMEEELRILIRDQGNLNDSDMKEVLIWSDKCWGYDEGDSASQWLSTFLGVGGVRLFVKADDQQRVINDEFTHDIETEYSPIQTGFADGYPFLLISTESIDDLNYQLKSRDKSNPTISTKNFRPNIVISGHGIPYYEDKFKVLKFNSKLRLYNAKPCTRCALPNVNPDTGVSSSLNEPLKTLMSYRRVDKRFKYNACLGINCVHETFQGETISVGDSFSVEKS